MGERLVRNQQVEGSTPFVSIDAPLQDKGLQGVFFAPRIDSPLRRHYPAISDILRGKKATSSFSIRWDLINAGAKWVDQTVVVDDRLVTSRQ